MNILYMNRNLGTLIICTSDIKTQHNVGQFCSLMNFNSLLKTSCYKNHEK